jgi:creatinine amidohydrolase/Fe(II)-dependent formamide hydrolase-like protein
MNMNMTPFKSYRARLVLLASFVVAVEATAQIHQLKEMNTEQLRALPRDNTVVVMPGAYIGEHGPYLPRFVDGFRNAWLAQELAEAIVERPGWHVVMFPFIPIAFTA